MVSEPHFQLYIFVRLKVGGGKLVVGLVPLQSASDQFTSSMLGSLPACSKLSWLGVQDTGVCCFTIIMSISDFCIPYLCIYLVQLYPRCISVALNLFIAGNPTSILLAQVLVASSFFVYIIMLFCTRWRELESLRMQVGFCVQCLLLHVDLIHKYKKISYHLLKLTALKLETIELWKGYHSRILWKSIGDPMPASEFTSM